MTLGGKEMTWAEVNDLAEEFIVTDGVVEVTVWRILHSEDDMFNCELCELEAVESDMAVKA